MIAPLQRRFDRLENARAEVEAALAALSPAQLAFRPGEDAWSIGEVLDHVVRVERSVLEGARKPGVSRARWRSKPLRRAITWLTFTLGIRIRVPQRVGHVTPERAARADEALTRWTVVRQEYRGFLASLSAEQLGELAIKHPIAGPFSYRNFLAFLEWHLRHHRRQIARIRRTRGFPSS